MFDMWTVFLACLVVFLYIWWRKTTRDAALPPGPPTVPFLGNILSVNPATLVETFMEYRHKYGDVFSLITGSKVLVIVSGYDTLREIFIKHGDVVSERPDIFFTREIGNFKELQLLKIAHELFVAGTKTTSTTLQWFFLFMIRNTDMQDKMRKEINNTIGSSRFPSMGDKPNLPYCVAVIHEVLRKATVLPLSLPHGLTSDFQYKGFTIPKDTILIPNLYSVSFDKDIFHDPHAFYPERFLDEKGNLQHTEKFLAFSLGRRACLGETLARMELFLFATTMIQRFHLLPVDPDHLPSEKGHFGITYAPKPFSLKVVSV